MELKFFCPRWGSEYLSWSDFFGKVKGAGYDGVEYAIGRSVTIAELDEVWTGAAKHGLLLIAQHYDTYESDFELHLALYIKWFERIKGYPVVKINSQTGKDHFSFEQNEALITVATRFSNETGVQVVHETHRNKFSFAAHITREYLLRSPNLLITLDASHWVCVAESFLSDQKETVDLAISRTEHIHARVGYPEGPQVTDPAAPECLEALNVHLQWWDKVVERKRNDKVLTISPEFGPYPYMVELPYTGQPVADQWSVNVWIMNLLRARYA
ncbi:MAG: sugar phosphate isomerase/epimerase [Bacteroidota bacterium]